MAREEIEHKAKEIANQWQEPADYNIARDAAMDMAEWMLSNQMVLLTFPPVTHWMPIPPLEEEGGCNGR